MLKTPRPNTDNVLVNREGLGPIASGGDRIANGREEQLENKRWEARESFWEQE